MFRKRQNFQKPSDELIQRFQKEFSDVVRSSTTGADAAIAHHQVDCPPVSPSTHQDHSHHFEATRPRPASEMPRINLGSLRTIHPFNQLHGGYSPTSKTLGAMYHSPAGDLYTPGLDTKMITSLFRSMPLPACNADMLLDQFHPASMRPYIQNSLETLAPQEALASNASVETDRNFGMIDDVHERSPSDAVILGPVQPQMTMTTSQDCDEQELQISSEDFRYRVTLRAPTAMISDRNDSPVTYLNKGQAYSITIVDTCPPLLNSQSNKYRTFIRISFHNTEQKLEPAACWQLWKEGRGLGEARRRGVEIRAVEYLGAIQGGSVVQNYGLIQLESSSFDGFCVLWSTNPTTRTSECTLSVQFNFLSTDFNRSKGVKGIAVRLCAKTEMVAGQLCDPTASKKSEVCYCKVKLFRDHGAERRLSNDITHVRKSFWKLQQQIQGYDIGVGSNGKWKRSSSTVISKCSNKHVTQLSNQRHLLSVSSQDGCGESGLGNDLHEKLSILQNMLLSGKPASVLGLRGDEDDDPDLYPVQFPDCLDHIGEHYTARQTSVDSNSFQDVLTRNNSMSTHSPCHFLDSQQIGPFNNPDCSRLPCELQSNKSLLKHPVRILKVKNSIEAVDIDPNYSPPAKRQRRPIACFYIQFKQNNQQQADYYNAVYLTERTARDMREKISIKQGIDYQRIARMLLVRENGFSITVDDDVIRELPDGQVMFAEISETSMPDSVSVSSTGKTPLEVKLKY